MCADAGIVLAYLPPYSPDFNPIEEAFAELKAWYKRNRTLAETFDTMEGFLRVGLEALHSKARGHFSRCQIGRTITDSESENGSESEQED